MTVITFRTQSICRSLLIVLLILALGGTALAASAKKRQKSFATPEEAVKSLVEAVQTNNDGELAAILGPGSGKLISSGDPVEDRQGRERFIKRYEEKNLIEHQGADRAILSIGTADYPFPIPLVKKGQKWFFDTRAGRQEILNRRIGRNELEVMDVLRAYVDAQREYAAKDHDGNGVLEFAQRLNSTPGKHDGLYWEAGEGEEESPFGPLAARADCQGYGPQFKAAQPEPFHGYYFKVLTAQGKDAEGGAFDYVVNGKMVLGFAMVAYPAKYRASGVMTFVVNQNGVIYQKDLGKETARLATAMKAYNPDPGWKKVD
ncbi:hypothetical protein GURASL_08930 [Geotalea uraniireducens]|uniref:DUF2950 domain-containing protein n=1 Tax=Geotalea uraniireducens TaxID=351604 RepID=A0ABM8EHS7_9BACT|nr:DUF2950 domain-containing protein [Geotalea uraniireducens]BDV41970.1 hypothetical protein GURASL_08930 [Geotalea uraniireducens]